MEAQHTEAPQSQPAPATGAQRTPSPRPSARVRAYSPPVDVFESQEAIVLHVDVPGVAKEDVTLRLEKNDLAIQATRRESLHGPIEYRRTFTIPQDVDGEAITADLSKGVLVLTLPRKASAKPRTIAVR